MISLDEMSNDELKEYMRNEFRQAIKERLLKRDFYRMCGERRNE